MLTQEQAAKYLIVAWIKGWTARQYVELICERSFERIEDLATIQAAFPWMPSDRRWYIVSKNRTQGPPVRGLISENYAKLNDRLWDAPDNATRVALHQYVQTLRAMPKCVPRSCTAAGQVGRNIVRAQVSEVFRLRQQRRDLNEAFGRRAWGTHKA